MQLDNLVVIVTFLALLTYFWTSIRVAQARHKYGVTAPAVTGAPEFERTYRVQVNTLEWLPLFLPSLWLFAWYWNGKLAAAIGVVWILARIYYAITYVKDPAKRARASACSPWPRRSCCSARWARPSTWQSPAPRQVRPPASPLPATPWSCRRRRLP